MSGKIYGYVRVSTRYQKEDRQMDAMHEFSVPDDCIIVEKQSGKDFKRPKYQKLLKKLRPGDTLVIKSIDRLGRNYAEIIEQWRIISKELGASIVVLDMPLLNTEENTELIHRLITDLVLQVFSYVAETERANIRQRQREGIEAAKARGVRFGRPRLELPACFEEMVERWRQGEITAREAAGRLGVSRSTFFRRVRELCCTKKADDSPTEEISMVRQEQCSDEVETVEVKGDVNPQSNTGNDTTCNVCSSQDGEPISPIRSQQKVISAHLPLKNQYLRISSQRASPL